MRRWTFLLAALIVSRSAFAVDLSALEAKMKPAVVHLSVTAGGREIGNGTGFFIRADGWIVTNHHVIADAREMTAKLADGREEHVTGVLADDKQDDLAIIKVGGANYPTLSLADPSTVKEGQEVAVIGSPMGLSFTLSSGNISALRLDGKLPEEMHVEADEKRPLVQITAPIAPGSSGSPVFNFEGQVIGVAQSVIRGGGDLNFAVFVAPLIHLRDSITPQTPLVPLAPSPLKNLLISAAVFAVIGAGLKAPGLYRQWRLRRRLQAKALKAMNEAMKN